MSEAFDISVVITTYNRCLVLPGAVASILGKEAAGVQYEVIVVDNNSTDQTRQVVDRFIEDGHSNLRYVFEGRQGISYGRNAGIATARAPIVAFTDDDVRVARDWVTQIKRAFDEHPDAVCVGGKILPRWPATPPSWLTRHHWWPLPLVDYGELPRRSDAERPLLLPTANAAFRRVLFERIGPFDPEFSGREDHELLVRLWRAGLQGIYVPEMVVEAEVAVDRLTKRYHRRWHSITGHFNSLMRMNETIGPDGQLIEETFHPARLFGVPGFLYRELMVECVRWVRSMALGRTSVAFDHESRVHYLASYIRTRYALEMRQRKPSYLVEFRNFAKALLQTKR